MRAVRHQFRRSSAPTSGARSACADSTGNTAKGARTAVVPAAAYLPAALEARTEGWGKAAASTPSIAWIETRYGNVLGRPGRDRRTPAALAFFQCDRRRGTQPGRPGRDDRAADRMAVAAAPTKNQAAYEPFWGCCPAGRRSSSPTRTTRSVAPSPPRCRARTPRRPSTPGRVAPWPLAARPTARCARGGRGRRGEGRDSSPRAQPGVRLIRDRHRIAAAVTGEVVFFATDIDVVEDDHPDRRFGVALSCASPRSTPARSADRATRPRSSGSRGHC